MVSGKTVTKSSIVTKSMVTKSRIHCISFLLSDPIKKPPPMPKSNGVHNLPVLHIPEYTPTQSFGGSVHKRTKKAQIPIPPVTSIASNSSGHPGKNTKKCRNYLQLGTIQLLECVHKKSVHAKDLGINEKSTFFSNQPNILTT